MTQINKIIHKKLTCTTLNRDLLILYYNNILINSKLCKNIKLTSFIDNTCLNCYYLRISTNRVFCINALRWYLFGTYIRIHASFLTNNNFALMTFILNYLGVDAYNFYIRF